MTALAATLTASVVLGTLYAGLYYWMDTKDPDHGITPWAVVVGVAIVGILFFALLMSWAGLDIALRYTASLAALFVGAGIPMIVGYYVHRYNRRRLRLE